MDKIYVLKDPDTLDIRYVGYTNRKKLNHRLCCHISESMRLAKCHRHHWINSLLVKGKRPLIELVKEITDGDWRYWETYYIKLYRKMGYNLTNGTNGGDGQTGIKHSPETRLKIRRSCRGMGKGRVFSENHRNNISKSLKGKPLSEKHRKSLRYAGLGRVQTVQTREKISRSNLLRDNPNKKPIRGIDIYTGDVRVFEGINEAIRVLKNEGIKVMRQHISRILNGRLVKGKYLRIECAGYYWQWENKISANLRTEPK